MNKISVLLLLGLLLVASFGFRVQQNMYNEGSMEDDMAEDMDNTDMVTGDEQEEMEMEESMDTDLGLGDMDVEDTEVDVDEEEAAT